MAIAASKMEQSNGTHQMKNPVQCAFWENPGLVLAPQNERFERVDTYADDDDHWIRTLLKCRECGQLYFFEFYEVVDWINGEDCHYATHIPVETNAEIETLRKTSHLELLKFYPRLQKDFPRGATKTMARWVGK
jgi:hypothetical protein